MNTNIEVLRELDELVEAARLLGVTQAKKGFGCYTDEDRRFERAMYESIDKHRAALLDWEAKQPAPPSAPVRVSWADFWIAQGDWPTANDYAAFEKAEQWLLAQHPAAPSGDAGAFDTKGAPAGDGCHCATCTCNPSMTPAVRFDLSPAQQEGAIREHLIRLGWTPPDGHALSRPAEQRAVDVGALRAERDALEAENERLHEQLRLATVDQAIAEAEASDAHAENKRLQESLVALEQEAGRG